MSVNALVAANSGAVRDTIALHTSNDISAEHLFHIPASADYDATDPTNVIGTAAVPAAPWTHTVATDHNISFFRHRRTAAVPTNLVATIHAGPRALGTVFDVFAFWAPSTFTGLESSSDVIGILPFERRVFGGAMGVPADGIRVECKVDLPLWSSLANGQPKLYVFIKKHSITGGANTATGSFIRVEVTGQVAMYGGF
jgi:hypothetical protein